jgi:hypothetical protein
MQLQEEWVRHVMQPKLPKDEGLEREQLVVSILRTLSNKHVRLYIGWVIRTHTYKVTEYLNTEVKR